MFISGSRATIRRLKREAREQKERALRKLEEAESRFSSSSDESEEESIPQTFPDLSTEKIIRQDDDLTCGMRCLQNIYGAHIVTRDEMDKHAQELEKHSFGFKMYDVKLGYYASEVLETVLQDKGKYVQRVALDKMTPEYYLPVIQMNPTFTGYIVALGTETLKHYVAVRYSNGRYRKIDSMPGVRPVDINQQHLFHRREDGHIYCSLDQTDITPVVAVLAVAGSPFLEYQLMHDIWPLELPTPSNFTGSIAWVLHPRRIDNIKRATAADVLPWYENWKQRRVMPDEKTMTFLKMRIAEKVSGEVSVVVKMQNEQTIVRCKSIQGLLHHLHEMQWINPEKSFYMQQNGRSLVNAELEEIYFQSEGTLDDYSYQHGVPIELIQTTQIHQAQIGGFYRFNCNIAGKCIGTQHNAYSVRDTDGKVHVVYKNSIEKFEVVKQ